MAQHDRRMAVAFALGLAMLLSVAMPARAQTGNRSEATATNGEIMKLLQRVLDENQKLQDKVRALEARVVTLERLVADMPGESGSDAEAQAEGGGQEVLARGALPEPSVDPEAEPTDKPLMLVEQVEVKPPDPALKREADALRAKAEARRKERAPLEAQRADLQRSECARWHYHCGCGSREAHDRNALERKRKREDISKRLVAIDQEAREIDGQATRLEKEYETVRQVIRGWDGRQTVELHTTKDCSSALARVVNGGCVTWTGKVLETNGDIQRWEVRNVVPANRPPTLKPRPGAAARGA